MRFFFMLSISLLLFCAATFGATYLVKPDGTGDFPTIQAAVDAAGKGDTILLANGTFKGGGNRNVDFKGKAITVRSQSGCALDCIIDPEGVYALPGLRAFDFKTDEGPDSVVRDITIRNGASDDC
jgi:hypothetical protein